LHVSRKKKAIVVGAGPAGLAAALKFAGAGMEVLVLEKEERVGGLSATLAYEQYRFDIGGHRFFTKNPVVRDFFRSVVKGRVLTVDRRSHIRFAGKLFDYPLSFWNALLGMGPLKSMLAGGSFLYHRTLDQFNLLPRDNFESYMIASFGKQLYRSFFEGYTSKVWGVPCNQLSADWASQRIRGMNLMVALKNALKLQRQTPATLVSQFLYPRDGFGALCDGMALSLEQEGGSVELGAPVTAMEIEGKKIVGVAAGPNRRWEADLFVFTNPLTATAGWLDQAGAGEDGVRDGMGWRGLVTVFLALDIPQMTQDHWIYLPEASVPFGRLHEPKNWSRDMAPANRTGVVAEYFAFPHDPLWTEDDEALVKRTAAVLADLKFIPDGSCLGGRVDRWKFAYPTYSLDYRERAEKAYALVRQLTNATLAGRTGMFRYHNADHAIETGWEAADQLASGTGNPFNVNLAEEYHEDK